MGDRYYGAMPDPKFKRGQKVFHEWWGRGVIDEVLPCSPNNAQHYRIRFDRTGHSDLFEERFVRAIDRTLLELVTEYARASQTRSREA